MSGWREQILEGFTPKLARLTLVADPDGLLLEERLLESIRARGFELISFDDHVAFRYAYESKFRSRWDRGETTELVVVLRSPEGDLGRLPYDLLKTGRRLQLSLGKLFGNLSYPVVAVLDKADLDALDQAQRQFAPGRLGDNATKDFILQHVFDVVPNLIKAPEELLRDLLRRHYKGQTLPAMLDARLIEVLRQKDVFAEWPLEQIVSDRHAFLTFLQERWPAFMRHLPDGQQPRIRQAKEDYGFEIPGPTHLPFDHNDVRVYVSALFTEGLLKPIDLGRTDIPLEGWMQAGIDNSRPGDRLVRIDGLVSALAEQLPAEGARHRDWIEFALRWAELLVRLNQCEQVLTGTQYERLAALQQRVDATFEQWVAQRFASLTNLPATHPTMVHHLPRHLARKLEQGRQTRVALVVVDGLSLDQWFVVKTELGGFRFSEDGLFAWLPTLTSVSRQAIFAARAPLYFPGSIGGTDREPGLWTQFWLDSGLRREQVAYAKVAGDPDNLDALESTVGKSQTRVLGVVVSKVDKIMHGMALGSAGMHNQVRQWTAGGFLGGLLELLMRYGYDITITSDHGNIEARGCGRPNEGAVSDVKGERVRVFESQGLRHQVAAKYPNAIEWPGIGLPEGYLPLFAPCRQAFVPMNTKTVCHGGMSIEELIVPWVNLQRSRK